MICVTDMTVWLAVHSRGWTRRVLDLPHEWRTPDIVADALHRHSSKRLSALGVDVALLSGDQILSVAALARAYPAAPRLGLFSMVLAQADGASLVTAEAALVTAAEAEGVDAYDMSWVYEQLVDRVSEQVGETAIDDRATQRVAQ